MVALLLWVTRVLCSALSRWAAGLQNYNKRPSPFSIKGILSPLCPLWVAGPVSIEQHPGASRKAAMVERAWPALLRRGHSASGPSLSHRKRDYRNESIWVTCLEQGLTLGEGSIRVYHHHHLNACNPVKPVIHSHFTGEKTEAGRRAACPPLRRLSS